MKEEGKGKECRAGLIKHNGNGTSTVRSWMVFIAPLVVIFLTWFGNWVLIKSKIPDLQKAQEKVETKYEQVNSDLQTTKLTMTEGLTRLNTTLQGIDARLTRIENNTRRDTK